MNASALDVQRARQAGELLELAALTPQGLSSAFEEVSDLLDVEMIQLFNFTRPEAPDMIVSPHRGGVYDDYIQKGWHQYDIYTHTAAKLHRHGQLISDSEMFSEERRKRDTFYQEFCRKNGIGGFRSWTFDLGGEKWAYTLMPRTGDRLSQRDRVVLAQFRRGADRACSLAASLSATRIRGIAEGLEMGGRPTIALDFHGKVAFVTPSAEALIGQGFSIRNGNLVGHLAEVDAEMRQLTKLAGSSRRICLRNFLIHRLDGGRPIVVMPIHVRDRGLDGFPGVRIMLMLADLRGPAPTDAGVLCEVFGLSAREGELGLRLAAGDSLDEAAAVLGVAVNTVRQMLKAVFAKTGTHRQAELVAMVLRILTR